MIAVAEQLVWVVNLNLRNELKLRGKQMKNKRKLILCLVLILVALVGGVVFAGSGACNRCSCEKFTFSGEEFGGSRVCTCGHRFIAHGHNDD